jgi:hypothetical protein
MSETKGDDLQAAVDAAFPHLHGGEEFRDEPALRATLEGPVRAALVAAGLAEATAERDLLAGALGSLWLYVDWRWLTKQLTTEEKEAWATCVERWSADVNEGSTETPVVADRWWLCPTCGISIRAKAEDGPHERCQFANDAERDRTARTRGPAVREAGIRHE